MPLYEYVCRKCDEQFEALVRDGEKPKCPSCGHGKLTKLLSVPAAHTAGSSEPPCPAKESGACGMSECAGNSCGFAQWQ
jgi:putative FmdB family regulatory protein